MVAIPRSALGITRLPVVIAFKWADNCYAKGDWTDFILNGDAAPDDRFNYRAILAKQPGRLRNEFGDPSASVRASNCV